jgi:phosphocarrier protein HPr
MKSRQLVVKNEGGVHLRVAAQVVKKVQEHQSTVRVTCKDGFAARADSIFDLLQLGATKGSSLDVTAEGPDEESTIQALSEVFEGGAGI